MNEQLKIAHEQKCTESFGKSDLANAFFHNPFAFEALFLAADDDEFGDSGLAAQHMLGLALGNPSLRRRALQRAAFQADLDELADLAPGTLGHEYVAYLEKHQLDPHFFPKPAGDTLLDWFKCYLRDTHDLMHLVAGYEPHLGEELAFQAFYSANLRSSFGMLCVSQSLHYLSLNHPEQLAFHMKNVAEANLRGSMARPLVWCPWEESWTKSLCQIRRELRVPKRQRPISQIRR